jgi:uncharacterized membrane protein YfcA
MTAFLFVAALAGGVLNSVAGGGSFIGLPALLYAGVSPVSANATTTFALWPGSISSAWAYRREVARAGGRPLALLALVSLAGGLLGGLLLIRTSDSSFLRLLPWLMLAAALTFTFSGRVSARLRRRAATPGSLGREPVSIAPWALALQLAIAIYGGYFGGGAGILMLATLSVSGMTDIHEMNGLKALLGVAINAIALAQFMAAGVIAWAPGLVMVAGAIVGGYTGASMARRIDGRYIRAVVVAVAWGMTAYFFVR